MVENTTGLALVMLLLICADAVDFSQSLHGLLLTQPRFGLDTHQKLLN